MLSYSPTISDADESTPIARDGDTVIYYHDADRNFVLQHDPDAVDESIFHFVNEAADQLDIHHLDSRKLINTENDIIARDPPRDRHCKRIYREVMEKIRCLESKIYRTEGILTPLPRQITGQTDRIYCFGPSGSGKSTWASSFAQNYQIRNPGNRVFLFSRKTHDPALDGFIRDLIRIPMDRSFISDQSRSDDTMVDYQNSLILFDDFQQLSDKPLRDAIFHFKNAVLELGRQYNISCVSINHKGLAGVQSIKDLTEATAIVCFPKVNRGESERLLAKYCYFSKAELSEIFDSDGLSSRWIMVLRPNIIIAPRFIKIIK